MYIYICDMKHERFEPNILKKLIELPLETAAGLALMASKEGYSTKSYMEKILISHESKFRKPIKSSKKQ